MYSRKGADLKVINTGYPHRRYLILVDPEGYEKKVLDESCMHDADTKKFVERNRHQPGGIISPKAKAETAADVIAKTPLTTYSVWSLAGPASLVFPVEAGSCYRVVDMLGEARLGQSCAEAGGQLRVENVTDAPLIVAQLAKAT